MNEKEVYRFKVVWRKIKLSIIMENLASLQSESNGKAHSEKSSENSFVQQTYWQSYGHERSIYITYQYRILISGLPS